MFEHLAGPDLQPLSEERPMAESSLRIAGVYRIRNLVSGRNYVGSARCIADRWKSHRHMLRHGQHHAVALQRSWDKHGEVAFAFEVLEECLVELLLDREQHWIDRLDAAHPKRGFNIATVAGTRAGVPQPQSSKDKQSALMRGVPKSAEHRAKIGAGNRGKVRSPETRARISAAVTEAMRDPERRARQAEYARLSGGNPTGKRGTLSADAAERMRTRSRNSTGQFI
jgi:group I intron endonuclease